VTVARTTLWIVLAASSVGALFWLSRASWEEQLRRLRDAPTAIRECPRLAYLTGAGIGVAAAALVLGGTSQLLSA
jgi:hypothetical protein